MKTKFLTLVVLVSCLSSLTAQRLISKTGHVWFYSHTPVEEIEAHNHQTVSILDVSTGDLQFSMLIKSFEFKIELMQEHFNVNYMESSKFPKAGFKGKITNLSDINFKKDGTYESLVEGQLTIHGISKQVSSTGTIEIKNGVPHIFAKFNVNSEDYDIQIPDLVKEKIAKEIEVTVDVIYQTN